MFRTRRGHSVVRNGRAFTLVELLVVVSIIALLIAILLPSLKKARQSAKRVHCNAGLRSIAQAGMTYATDDPREFAIPVGKADASIPQSYTSYVGFGGKSGLGVNHDASQSPFGQNAQMNSIYRPLNFVMFKGGFGAKSSMQVGRVVKEVYDADLELDVYHCAGDNGFPGMHQKGWKDSGLSGYDYYGTSYSANPYLVGPSGGGALSSNSMYLRSLSRVPNPANTVYFTEYAMRYAVFADNTEYRQSGFCWPWGAAAYAPAYGHHGMPWHFNVSFADGHATWIKIKGFGRLDGVKKAPFCKAQSCECLIQRGLGWQIDTMPSDLIETIDVLGSPGKVRDGSDATMVATRGGGDGIWDMAAK